VITLLITRFWSDLRSPLIAVELRTTARADDLRVSAAVVHHQAYATHANKGQHRGVGSMAGRVSLLLLTRFVNPDSDDLTRRAERHVHGNDDPNGGGRVHVRRKPSEEWWDTGKRTRGCDNETVVASL
jgi:hypothetical protein